MVYRPDESANLADIERDKLMRSRTKKAIGAAGSFGLGLGYGKIAQKILPYISEALPLNVALDGIEKVSPKIANFLRRGQKMGLDIQEGMDFVKETLTEKKEPEYQSIFKKIVGDIDIESLDPGSQKELSFLKMITDQLESKGKTEKDPSIKNVARKIKNVLKGKQSMVMQEMARTMEPGMQNLNPQQQQNTQMGPGQKALMDVLQRIQSKRGM